jgi:hypothetical protein
VQPSTDVIFDSASDIESAALRIRLMMHTIIEKAGHISDAKGASREAINAIDCFAEITLRFADDIIASNEKVLSALSQGGK